MKSKVSNVKRVFKKATQMKPKAADAGLPHPTAALAKNMGR